MIAVVKPEASKQQIESLLSWFRRSRCIPRKAHELSAFIRLGTQA